MGQLQAHQEVEQEGRLRAAFFRMPAHPWTIRRLLSVDDAQVDDLADVLIDCVEGGASVSFMLPLTRERATAF